MADDIDRAQAQSEQSLAAAEAAARYRAAHIPPGRPGDCDFCGEWSARLVDGACAPCRDRLHLP